MNRFYLLILRVYPKVEVNYSDAGGFFATIKKELIHKYKFTTRREAAAAIFEYIEAFYNRVRNIQSSVTPVL